MKITRQKPKYKDNQNINTNPKTKMTPKRETTLKHIAQVYSTVVGLIFLKETKI